MPFAPIEFDKYLPPELKFINLTQSSFPTIAKNKEQMEKIRKRVQTIPTAQKINIQDSRLMNLEPESVHLVVTSPPYWTLKKYNEIEGQLAELSDYEEFVTELDKVWARCYDALIPSGRMAIVVGDVCLSRRKNERHQVIPLHSSIQEHCRKIGFDNLAPIIWYKITNMKTEASGGSILGKPYEPGCIIKNDIEYILFLRKPGQYRSPTASQRILSLITEDEHRDYFQQIWQLPGAHLKKHPAPFPVKIAERLVKMFSFVGDTVLDPFLGTGTTLFAAGQLGRNGIGIEIDPEYAKMSFSRLKADLHFKNVVLEDHSKRIELENSSEKKAIKTIVEQIDTQLEKTAPASHFNIGAFDEIETHVKTRPTPNSTPLIRKDRKR